MAALHRITAGRRNHRDDDISVRTEGDLSSDNIYGVACADCRSIEKFGRGQVMPNVTVIRDAEHDWHARLQVDRFGVHVETGEGDIHGTRDFVARFRELPRSRVRCRARGECDQSRTSGDDAVPVVEHCESVFKVRNVMTGGAANLFPARTNIFFLARMSAGWNCGQLWDGPDNRFASPIPRTASVQARLNAMQ